APTRSLLWQASALDRTTSVSPSKEALVAAVSERHSHEVLQLIRSALVKVAARPIELAAHEFVSFAIPSFIASLPNGYHVLATRERRGNKPRRFCIHGIRAGSPALYAATTGSSFRGRCQSGATPRE